MSWSPYEAVTDSPDVLSIFPFHRVMVKEHFPNSTCARFRIHSKEGSIERHNAAQLHKKSFINGSAHDFKSFMLAFCTKRKLLFRLKRTHSKLSFMKFKLLEMPREHEALRFLFLFELHELCSHYATMQHIRKNQTTLTSRTAGSDFSMFTAS